MVNFDSSHKSVDENIKKKKGKSLTKRILATGLIIVNLITFAGCAKTMPCDIEGDHAHLYIDPDTKIERYIESEKSYVDGMDRTDEYIVINQEQSDLLKFMNKKDLFRIDENKEALQNIESQNQDYLEYRYKYIYMQPVPIVHSNGKFTFVTYNYIPITKYSWTTDQSRNLTGETRVCHYTYYGYKVYQDENGKYKMEKSDLYESISDIPDEYEYVGNKYTAVVNGDTYEVLDYEDLDDYEDVGYNSIEDAKEEYGDVELDEMMDEYDDTTTTSLANTNNDFDIDM